MHRFANRLVPGLLPALWHVLVLKLGTFQPRPQVRGRQSPRLFQMAGALLVALAGITSQAMALDWVEPSITISFVPDDSCVAGPYENAATTRVAFAWTAMNTDIEPSHGINLTGWNKTVTNQKASGVYENVPVGQLPLQTTLANSETKNLIDDLFLYVSLVDSWQTGIIRSQDRLPVLSANVTAPNYGASGETRIDTTTEPNCTPPVITGTLSATPDGGAGGVTLSNNVIIDVSEAPILEFVFAYARVENSGGGTLEITSTTLIDATNATIQSVEPSGTRAAGFLVVPRLRPWIAGPLSGTFEIMAIDPSMPTLTITVIGTAVDTTPPTVTWIMRDRPATSPTDADMVSWRLRYSEALTGVRPDEFRLIGSLSVSGSANIHVVTATGGDLSSLNGTVRLQHAGAATMVDPAGTALVDFTPTGVNYDSFDIVDESPGISGSVSAVTEVAPGEARLVNGGTLNLGNSPGRANAFAFFSLENAGGSDLKTISFVASSFIKAGISPSAATGLAVATNFPTGPLVAPTPDLSNTCCGTWSAASGSDLITLTLDSVAGGATCEFAANVVSERGKPYEVEPCPLVTSQGQVAASLARLDVFNIPPSLANLPLAKQRDGIYFAHITLSQSSPDFVGSDLTLTNATATLAGSGTHFTATLTPLADGPIALSLAANRFTEPAINGNTSSIALTAIHDGTSPTVAIRNIPATTNAPFTAPFILSEPMTGFSAAGSL